MKKIFLIIITLLLFVGCSNDNKDIDNNVDNSENTNYELLEGYPEDILPLYKVSNLERMEFSYRDDYEYVIGKDIYTVYYESFADIDEISDYYMSLYTSIDDMDEEWFDKYSFEGNIGNNRVNIGMYESNDIVNVSLTIGLTEDKYVSENPFFEDAPTDLIVVHEMTELQEYTYRKDYSGEINYIVIFESNFNTDTFKEYYEGLYKNKTDYKYEITEYYDVISFKDGKYSVRISYSESYGYNFVNIEVSYTE